MTSDTTITDLFARLNQQPRDPAALEDLARLYLDASTTEPQRAQIRETVAKNKPIANAFPQWSIGNYDADPVRFVQLTLARIAIMDGWPDPRDEYMAVQWLRNNLAPQHNLDLEPYLQAAAALSTPRVAHLLLTHQGLNLKLWLGK